MANSATASPAVSTKKIILLRPRGFCAGVVRAIDVVKIALSLYGAPIYVRKEIVHNKHVVDELRAAGAIFIEVVFNYPGMGLAFYNAALNVDYQVLLGFTLVATLATVVGNILADVGYAVLDPRVRYS